MAPTSLTWAPGASVAAAAVPLRNAFGRLEVERGERESAGNAAEAADGDEGVSAGGRCQRSALRAQRPAEDFEAVLADFAAADAAQRWEGPSPPHQPGKCSVRCSVAWLLVSFLCWSRALSHGK